MQGRLIFDHMRHERIAGGAVCTIEVIHVVAVADGARRRDQLALKLIFTEGDVFDIFGAELKMSTRRDEAVGGGVQPKLC